MIKELGIKYFHPVRKKYLLLLCIFFSFKICCQIVNEGTLHIDESTVLYFGDEYSNNGTHANNGDLYLNSSFINNGVTTANSGTTYFSSIINSIQTISGTTNTINFYNLTINNNLTGVEVVDEYGLILGNALNLINGDLRLTGDAQLVQTHTGFDVNSSVSGQLLRDQQGNSSVFVYNYCSSPVNNSGSFSISEGLFDGSDASINPFAPQSVLFNSGSPYNGFPSVLDGGGNVIIPLTLNTSFFYKYARGGGTVAEWIKIDENSDLNPAEGFTMRGTNTIESNQNYVFKGAPNNGDYQFSISLGEYTLTGNPYPSAINAEEFIRDNISVASGGNAVSDVITGTLYFWVDGGSTDHFFSGRYGGYATKNLTAGAPPSVVPEMAAGLGNSASVSPPEKYIAVAQGFFLEGADTGNVVFKNSQREFITESSGESVHYKNSKTDDRSIIRIGYEDPEGFHRQLVLGFMQNNEANLNYNIGYDALMFDLKEDDIYFIIDNDLTKKYVIQGVGDFNETLEIPIGMTIAEEGTHTIMLDTVKNFNNDVYIKDLVLNTTYNLTDSDFTSNLPIGEYLDRFKIVFQPQSTLDINDFDKSKLKVYYNGNGSIIISNQNNISLNKVEVFNMLGQKLLKVKSDLLYQTEIVIPFNNNDGMYLVKIESLQGEETYKILKR